MLRRASARGLLAAAATAVLYFCATPASAAVSVMDDARHVVTLQAPAHRIISLSPHATELLFAIGAGPHVVGVIEYSNYPPEAIRIPSVGSSTALDLERIIALKPDLIVNWGSGNPAAQIAKLRAAGIPVFNSEPRDFETIASSMERLAQLAGTGTIGKSAAENFRMRLKKLATAYQQRPAVTVFYQIWREPLMTLNDAHIVSAAIRLCGGRNVFGKLPQLAPTVSTEAVLKANPDVIISGSGAEDDGLSRWRRFPTLNAVAHENLFAINSDLLTRAAPRILDGTEMLCKDLDVARSKRK